MKRARISVALILLVLSVVFVYAGNDDFWDNKPYTEWNEKEVSKLLKNSPWSKTVTLSVGMGLRSRGGFGAGEGDASSLPRGGAQGAEDSSSEGAGGRSGVGRGGGLGDFGEGPVSSVVITWYARPVREAMARSFLLRNPETTKDQLDKILNHDSSTYDLLVVGWPGRNPREAMGDALQRIKEETFLLKKNKVKIPLTTLIPPSGVGQPLVLRFARTAERKPAIDLDDKEVDLVTRLGGSTIRTRFKLADMVIAGQLEL